MLACASSLSRLRAYLQALTWCPLVNFAAKQAATAAASLPYAGSQAQSVMPPARLQVLTWCLSPSQMKVCADSCWDGSCGWPGRRSSSNLPAGARLAPEPLDAFSDVTIREPLRQGVDGELFRAEWRGSRVAVKVGLHASTI